MSGKPASELTAREVREEWLRGRIERGERLDAFIRRVSPAKPPPRHYGPIIAEIERAVTEGHRRVCISMPPRHGKTTLFQHAFAWWLKRYGGDTCAYFSYNEHQGLSKSAKTRDLALVAGVELSDEEASKAEWRTRAGGGLLAGGVGSGLTGQGVSGLMVVDDPFKDRADAESKVIRDKVHDWFNDVVMTRLEGASVFVIHTRWHQDDLIGRLSKDPEWRVINLPALAEPEDPLGRAEGEALWPERFDSEYLEKQKKRGEYSFAALYQGRPVARGAKVFGDAHYYQREGLDLTGCRFTIAVDPAGSEKTSADYSAIVALAIRGRDPDTMVTYVLEVYRHQVATPQLVDDLIAFQARHGNAKTYIEESGGSNSQAVRQSMLKIRPTLRVEGVPPLGDKFTRAQGVAAAWNDGRVLVPMGVPWLEDFLEEVTTFTGIKDAHDDQVDALAHAWNSTKPPDSYRSPGHAGNSRVGNTTRR